jgi:DNA-binding SARP family transcriptional activator
VLQQRFRSRLTTVSAGPGFGKTSLLAQAVAENRLAPRGLDVWVTCTESDTTASTLAGTLSEAFELRGTASWDPDVVVDRLVDEMWGRAPHQVALVVDEAHLVVPGSPGGELLATLLHRMPRNGHLVLATRDRLPVSTARLASLGQLTELRESDLVFTADEIAAFADLRGVPTTVLDRLGGWPALAELSAATGDNRMLDYLWEELLQGLDVERRRDLAVLCLVPEVDAELAAALTGHPVDLDATLADLPLVSGRAGSERALHPLWTPALMRLLGDAEAAEARGRAAQALRERGQVETAVRLFIEARRWDAVRAIASETALRTHPLVAPDVIEQWHRALPEGERRAPEAALMQAMVTRAHDLEPALPLFMLAAERFERAGNVTGVVAALTHAAHIAWWLDDVEAVEAAARHVEQYADELPWLAGVAALGRALAADARDDAAGALAVLSGVDETLVPPTMTAGLDWMRAWEWLFAGRPERAVRHAVAAVDGALGTFQAPALNVAVLSRWQAGELSAALELLPRFAEATRATGRDLGTVFERSQCAALLAFAGRVEEAETHLAAARAALPGAGHAPMAEISHAVGVAAVLVARGEDALAAAALQADLDSRPSGGPGTMRWHRMFPALSYVLVPETRTRWDGDQLGPTQALGRDLGRALVGLRSEGDVRQAARLAWSDPGLIRAQVPLPWLVELAVAAVAGGQPAASPVLDGIGPESRTWLKRLSKDSSSTVARTARTLLAQYPVPPSYHLEIRVLGPLEVLRDGVLVDVPDLRRERVRQLLEYLVFRGPVSRATVGSELWPDLAPEAAARNLRVTLSYLQRVLEPDREETAPPWFLQVEGGLLRLQRGNALDVDLDRFEATLDAAHTAAQSATPSLALHHLTLALSFYRGDALADLAGADWADLERDRLRVRFVTAAIRCGELLMATGDLQTPLDLALRALRTDPYSEAAYGLLTAVRLERGELDAARQTYRRCHKMLQELGLPPGPPIEMVARRLELPSHSPVPRRR